MAGRVSGTLLVLAIALASAGAAFAQQGFPRSASTGLDYVIGPKDAPVITAYDDASLSGRFVPEADGHQAREVELTDVVLSGDTIVVPERFF